MKQPKLPKKIIEPKKPCEKIKITHTHYLTEGENLFDIVKNLKNAPLNEIIVKYEYDLCLTYTEEIDNLNYQKEMQDYNKRMEKYLKDAEIYNKELERYKEESIKYIQWLAQNNHIKPAPTK